MLFYCYYTVDNRLFQHKGGSSVKVLFAATEEQEEKIIELIDYLYTNIFPQYYEDEDIEEFKEMGVLYTSKNHFEYFGTLKDAFQVISSLQTIIAILEERSFKKLDKHYKELFNQNVAILEKYELSFPFYYQQFDESDKSSEMSFSIYKKAANDMLI